MLMGDVEYFVRNRVRLSKVILARMAPGGRWFEPLRASPPPFAQPRCIDGSIDGYIPDVYALWPEVTRKRLRQYALRGFSRRKERIIRHTSKRCGIAGHDD